MSFLSSCLYFSSVAGIFCGAVFLVLTFHFLFVLGVLAGTSGIIGVIVNVGEFKSFWYVVDWRICLSCNCFGFFIVCLGVYGLFWLYFSWGSLISYRYCLRFEAVLFSWGGVWVPFDFFVYLRISLVRGVKVPSDLVFISICYC